MFKAPSSGLWGTRGGGFAGSAHIRAFLELVMALPAHRYPGISHPKTGSHPLGLENKSQVCVCIGHHMCRHMKHSHSLNSEFKLLLHKLINTHTSFISVFSVLRVFKGGLYFISFYFHFNSYPMKDLCKT